MKKSFFITILLLPVFLFADDLIVDKSSISQYVADNFLRFDPFDGNNTFSGNPSATPDTIDISSKAIVLGSTFTQEAWIYSDQKGDASYQNIIGYAPTGRKANDTSPSVRLIDSGTGIWYGFGDGSTLYSYTAKDVIATQGWYHIAVTFDGTNYILFLNGSQVYTYTGATGRTPLNTPIKYMGSLFQGKIDEVRMWDVARTESEIKDYMNTRLSGAETNLVAYYPMDINGDYQLIDLSPNQNHGIIKNVNVMQRFSSNDCSQPDGTESCPYPTINSALDNAKPGDRILIKQGRYSEYIKIFEYNNLKIEGYPGHDVMIDGTIPLNTNWVPYTYNGHSIYKTVIDFDSLSYRYGIRVDSVYSVFVNDRYMIMSMPVNFKNPTDSINGDPKSIDASSPASIYLYQASKADSASGSRHENYSHTIKSPVTQNDGSTPTFDLGFRAGELANLDTLEEWSFDPGTGTLYLYPSDGFVPNNGNVRIRTKMRLVELHMSDHMEFRNLHFFSGTFNGKYCDYITVEDSKFSFSTDMYANGVKNGLIYGEYSWWRNLVFEHSNNGPPLYNWRHMYPTMENILFTNHSWFSGSHHYSTATRNYRLTDGNFVYGPDIWRYITVMNSNSAGIFPGFRSLAEYIRIENIFDYGDGSGIQRNGAATDSSTTRYSWIINAPRWNGLRWNSSASGHHADMHHVVSIGNSRGFRLKGDWHDAYHLLANDNARTDISLPDYKYMGIDKKTSGSVGNANSKIKNTAVHQSFECMALDCLPERGANKDPFALDSSGIFYLRNITKFNDRSNPYYNLDVELENPWSQIKAYSDQNLLDIHGVGPVQNKIQNYDFRPKKGSALIDGGVVIPGINDGQDKTFNHVPFYPGQNRKYVGSDPDIGAYEYGDSVYWIPGYRYPYPSVPIPSDGATDISLEYGLAWNYPYKKDYTNVSATIMVMGPGVSRTEIFQYPNNVFFETFEPGGTYHWSVIVDGVSSPTWKFTVRDRSYPLNDVSVDTTIIGIKTKDPDSLMVVSNNRLSFMRFDIPASTNNSYKIGLNLMLHKKYSLSGGIVLYKYDFEGWNESFNTNNIGLIDKSRLTPLDTLFSMTEGEITSLDLTEFIENNGEYSIALGTMSPGDSVSFYSSEKLLIGKAGYRWELPYIPDKRAWPSLSFSKDSLSIAYDIPMEKGWNLISVPFTGVKTHPKQIFRSLIRKGLLEYISSPKGYFKPKDPYSTLTAINSKEGYYIKLNGPLNKIFFRGRALTDKTISLSAGWNMIAYYPDYELAVDKAFESLIASNTLQYVTGFVQGALVYDPDAPQSSTLNTLKPTKGYWVKVKEAVTSFSFPAQTQGDAVGKIASSHSVQHPEVKPNPSFMFVKGKIMGRYNVGDWVKVLSEDNLVVGAAEIIEGGYLRNSAVYGDDVTTEDIDGLKSGEKISFAYHSDTLASHVQFNPMSFHDVKLDYDTFLPTTFALYQNHPNPFNPITTIRYDLPEDGPVSIIIYDLMGREIKTLVKQVSAPGRYSVNWNGRNQFGKQIASGMYFYRMETPKFQSVKKLIFLK